jgi:hypothetical protein
MPLLQALAVPLLGLLGRVTTVRGTARLRAKIEMLQKLHEALPSSTRVDLEPLIAQLIKELVRRERRRLGRTVDAGSAATVVFVATVGGATFAWGWSLGTWWSLVLGGAIALFATLLLAVGITTIYKYPPDSELETQASTSSDDDMQASLSANATAAEPVELQATSVKESSPSEDLARKIRLPD